MDINNIALVRATNVVPFDGIVKPLSHVPYLCKNIGLEFSFKISDLLKRSGIIPPMEPAKMFDEDYYDNMVREASNILKEYLPYVSDYNSMVLFSLNGICPDDNEHGFGNNTFSNKKVAIIEPLKEHIKQVVSLVPTDTALKGDVVLSSKAILLIEEKLYKSLNDEDLNRLNANNFSIKTFNGSLKDAIIKELSSSGVYYSEQLSLSSSNGGFVHSETSEMQKACIEKIASDYMLSQNKYFNLITSKDETLPQYDKFCDEFNRMIEVQEYYVRRFLLELLNFLNGPKDIISYIEEYDDYHPFLINIISLIEQMGMDNYKKFVDKYNQELELEQKNGLLKTPEEIVSTKTYTIN